MEHVTKPAFACFGFPPLSRTCAPVPGMLVAITGLVGLSLQTATEVDRLRYGMQGSDEAADRGQNAERARPACVLRAWMCCQVKICVEDLLSCIRVADSMCLCFLQEEFRGAVTPGTL